MFNKELKSINWQKLKPKLDRIRDNYNSNKKRSIINSEHLKIKVGF